MRIVLKIAKYHFCAKDNVRHWFLAKKENVHALPKNSMISMIDIFIIFLRKPKNKKLQGNCKNDNLLII